MPIQRIKSNKRTKRTINTLVITQGKGLEIEILEILRLNNPFANYHLFASDVNTFIQS